MAKTWQPKSYAILILFVLTLLFMALLGPAWAVSDLPTHFYSTASSSPKASLGLNEGTDEAVGRLVATAERYYREGEEHAKAGRRDQARLSFDRAVGAIQHVDFNLRSTPRLQEYMAALMSRVAASGTKTGDGMATAVTSPDEKPLALSKTANAEPGADPEDVPDTSVLAEEVKDAHLFPLAIDPALRAMVSEDIAKTRYSIPVIYNERVAQFLNLFQMSGRRERFADGLARSGKYLPMIKKYFSEAGIPQEVIYMAMVESLFNPYALSRARARGIWQFMAPTGKLYGLRQDAYIDERCDPEKSTQAAVKHTLDLYRQFGDWHLVMAAYNVGAGAMQRAIDRAGTKNFWELAARRALPRETIDHIPLIMASILIARNPEKYGFSSELSRPLDLDQLTLGHPVSLGLVSKLSGLSVEEIKSLNPELRGGCTPPNYPEYKLKLPQGMGNVLQSKLAEIPVGAWLRKSDLKRPPERMALGRGKRRGQKTALTYAAKGHRAKKKRGQVAEYTPVSAKSSGGKRTASKVKRGG